MSNHLAIDGALGALGAAATARRHYGATHPAAVSSLARAVAEIGAALEASGTIEVHVMGERVLSAQGTLPSSEAILSAVFAPLAAAGVRSLRLATGLSVAEYELLVSVLAGEKEPGVLGATGVSPGRGEIAPASDAPAPVAGSAHLIESYRELATADAASGAMPGARLEAVAAGVCMAVMNARGTMLEIASLKTYDEYTYVHTINVALLTAALAEVCGLAPRDIHAITLAAMLHDAGKRVLPIEILSKRAPLDDAERKVMQRHPVDGARLLMGQRGVPEIAPIVAFEHHMHIDGTGYPERPKAWRPHFAAQIVQQADVYDALRTNRPYRAAMSADEAAGILRQGAGNRYDAELVGLFIERVASRSSRDAGERAGSVAAAA